MQSYETMQKIFDNKIALNFEHREFVDFAM